MIAAEPEKANLIALTQARTALRAATLNRSPSRRCYTARATQQHPDRRSIASVTALAARWRRRGVWARNFRRQFTGADAIGVNDACAGYVL